MSHHMTQHTVSAAHASAAQTLIARLGLRRRLTAEVQDLYSRLDREAA
jgi:hypothetical protein